MKCVTQAQLAAEIDRVRHAKDGELRSNYFFPRLHEAELPMWSSARSLIFLDRDHDFHRVYFLSRDLSDLTQVLAGVTERPLVVDYVTNQDDHAAIDAAFTAAGFSKMAVYLRMTNKEHARRRAAAGRIAYAEPAEADALFDTLCRDFDTRLDHIPDRESFRMLVGQKQAIVHRSNGEIDAYMVFQLQGRKAHPNYWHSRPDNHPAVALKVYADFFAEMAARGIRTSFLWVEARKTAEIAVYERLGYERDGLVTHTYVNG